MEDRAGLVRLAFRVRALSVELEEMDRLLNEVVVPGIRHASATLRDIQAQLRDVAGVERIDVQGAGRAVDVLDGDAAGEVEPAGGQAWPAAGDDEPHRPI